MAQVFQRNGVWYARFMHHGKDYARSTRVSVETGSKKAAHEAKTQAEAELDRMLAEIRGRESVDALFARMLDALDKLPKHEREPKRIILADRLRSGVQARLAITDAWQAWLDSPKKRTPSEATLRMYRPYWEGRRKANGGFKNWILENHEEITCLHEVSPVICEQYASDLWGGGVAPRTYNGSVWFLKAMFRTLSTRAGLVSNPWDGILSQENDTEGRRNLTPEELDAICTKSEGSLRYWIALGLYTGMRLGDVVTLKWSEIDFDNHIIRRIPSKTRRKGKVVTFPLHPVLEALLIDLRENAPKKVDYLFSEAELHIKGKSSTITRRIQNHFEACGIQTTEQPTGPHRKMAIVRVGFHSLRHSFISLCAANHVPQAALQELVGHSSPAMTALYSHAGDEQKADAIAGLPAMSFENGEEGQS